MFSHKKEYYAIEGKAPSFQDSCKCANRLEGDSTSAEQEHPVLCDSARDYYQSDSPLSSSSDLKPSSDVRSFCEVSSTSSCTTSQQFTAHHRQNSYSRTSRHSFGLESSVTMFPDRFGAQVASNDSTGGRAVYFRLTCSDPHKQLGQLDALGLVDFPVSPSAPSRQEAPYCNSRLVCHAQDETKSKAGSSCAARLSTPPAVGVRSAALQIPNSLSRVCFQFSELDHAASNPSKCVSLSHRGCAVPSTKSSSGHRTGGEFRRREGSGTGGARQPGAGSACADDKGRPSMMPVQSGGGSATAGSASRSEAIGREPRLPPQAVEAPPADAPDPQLQRLEFLLDTDEQPSDLVGVSLPDYCHTPKGSGARSRVVCAEFAGDALYGVRSILFPQCCVAPGTTRLW
uniref:Uncharacterized protein n=1 Tax=Tetraselmis sp. GSL018 TaxID=582737 RepID=A0A061R1D4_9CHLO|mmetsp:Transcript_34856/g.82690  ORF Transcript_34856/g.82690 Transcript_34856/m.82690 type:complete len:400 (+) Transcript_34856:252-1451(+)